MNKTHTFSILLLFLFLQKTTAQELSLYLGDDKTIPCGFIEIDPLFLTGDIASFTYSTNPNINLPCTTCISFDIELFETTTFTLSVTDTQGESVIDSMTITVEKNTQIFIPNAFSPNQDGYNDRFNIYGNQFVDKVLEMYIWNRNMQLVYERKFFDLNVDDGWDGKLRGKQLNPGTFIYAIRVRYFNGRTETFYGDVMISP